MSNRSLADILDELVRSDRVRLPVYPEIARQTAALLQEQGGTPARLEQLANRDPALVCNLFRAANSSFFEGLPKTRTLDEAITRLGVEKTGEVLIRACRENAGETRGELLSRYLPPLWQHAHGCALGARWLAKRAGYQGIADHAYLAGLLHDIGKLFLLAALDQAARSPESGPGLSDQLVTEVIETMHIEQGKRLIADWNLPEIYAQVIDDHHAEELEQQDIIVSLVKLANKGCHKIGLGLLRDDSLILPTTAEAQFLGIDEIALAEFEIMLEDQFLGTDH